MARKIEETQLSRRQRLDEEHAPLLGDDGMELAKYGPSLITVIFNVSTLIDATLFFISGFHLQPPYDAIFTSPRVPSSFMNLLPSSGGHYQRKTNGSSSSKSSKKCAFFTITTHDKRLIADVKLFQSTAHVCGLRNLDDARVIMEIIERAFEECQRQLEDEDAFRTQILPRLSPEVRTFLEANRKCCTIPLIISEGDVVMTNMCGKFSKNINLRSTYELIRQDYPGVLGYLTTMSKSNYLVITLFEKAPFEPITKLSDMSPSRYSDVIRERRSYLLATKRTRSKHGKHTFFIYASGRFIQSSRNNTTALEFTKKCMKLLTDLSLPAPSPQEVLADDDHDLEVEIEDEEEEEEEERFIKYL